MEKYVSLEKFLNVSQVSENTIRKRYKDIPGIKYENGKFEILEGTRFPFNIRHNALKTDENRLLVLLKAIDQRKYIDASILRVYQSDFEELLWTLLMGHLIKPNGSANRYGANAYSITEKGIEYRKKKGRERAEWAATVIGKVIKGGPFDVISEIWRRLK